MTSSTSNWSLNFVLLFIIQNVPKPMSQLLLVIPPPLIKQKSSYQRGSKSEHVPRYPLTFMCGYPLSITQDVRMNVGMNLPRSRRRCAMHKIVRVHGSRRFGNVSWYRRLASCALPLARPQKK